MIMVLALVGDPDEALVGAATSSAPTGESTVRYAMSSSWSASAAATS